MTRTCLVLMSLRNDATLALKSRDGRRTVAHTGRIAFIRPYRIRPYEDDALQWLTVRYRIISKICTVTHQALSSKQPVYLHSLLQEGTYIFDHLVLISLFGS